MGKKGEKNLREGFPGREAQPPRFKGCLKGKPPIKMPSKSKTSRKKSPQMKLLSPTQKGPDIAPG